MSEYKMKTICKHFRSSQDRQCLLTDKNCIGYEICDDYKEVEQKEENSGCRI